ncbi:MAG TPA: plastocyanin/azurin family copper-binding protein, partial [Alphaproteobacteria bacterium]|nr:plastocyanin/azurin family copper-binding protein [Alphaproteobacteria bacterium]
MKASLFALALGLGLLAAPALGADTKILIQNFTFTPTHLEVKSGTTVIFKNEDDIPHSVVAVDGSFHSRALDTDDQVSLTLTKPGDFA